METFTDRVSDDKQLNVDTFFDADGDLELNIVSSSYESNNELSIFLSYSDIKQLRDHLTDVLGDQ